MLTSRVTPVMHCRSWRLAAALALLAAAACRPEFQLKKLTTNEALYTASLHEYQRHHWDNAVTGFEKLTTDLPARDSLLPRSYWYLASAHQHLNEYLLAAQSYSRLLESFPEDSLADDAGLEAARSYKKLWRKPALDPTYGETALASYQTLIGLYPTSPLVPVAQKEIGDLENMFAEKDYIAGMYYFRRHCYDCANIYFQDVLAKYASSPTAKQAGVKLVESFKKINYKADAQDMCAQLRQKYPGDRDVEEVCRDVPQPAAAKADSTQPPVKPPGS